MKLIKKVSFLVFLICFGSNILAQNEGNIWYFGQNAGMDFNGGAPVPLFNGALTTIEGCSSISDNNGVLLFYSDGSTVYNANHVAMPNGTGLNGNSSSTQSAVIVQNPGTSNLYYIFTIDAGGGIDGLNYSEVDINLQGGLGDVTANINVPVVASTTEKVTAVQHANGTDYWIVTLISQTDEFQSYLLTGAGLNMTPIVSTFSAHSNIGYLRSSPQGDRIAVANTFNNSNHVKLYDFDNSTGVLSNELTFSKSNAYGVEFSPSGDLLYVSCENSTANLFQYNLQAGTGTVTDIVNSELNLSDPNGTNTCGALQIGPDLKIYQAKNGLTTLGVISDPDVVGIGCNYAPTGFSLGTQTSYLGLPTFFNSIYGQTSVSNFSICAGDSVFLYNANFQNYNWAFANTPSSVFSTDSAITVSPSTDTDYVLIDGTDTAFFNITVSPAISVDLGPDLSNCDQNTIILHDFNNNSNDPSLSFLWQDGSTDDSLVTSLNGTFWLTVSSGACTDSDTIVISEIAGVIVLDNNPICPGTPTGSIIVNVPGSANDFTFVILNSDSVQVNTVGTNAANNLVAGWYYITYTFVDGCEGEAAVQLIDPLEIQTTLSLTSPLCHGEAGGTATVTNIINYQGDINDINYIWTPNPQNNNGLLTDAIFELVAGEYNLEVIDDFGCINSQVFYITEPNPLQAVISDNIPTFCRTADFQSGNGVLAAEVPGETSGTPPISFGWQNLTDGQTANTSTVVMRSPGQVVLIIIDNNNCIYRDTVLLDSLNPIADFTIESDEFTIPEVYEGTELLSIKVTNLSQNFAQAINPNSDTIFQWNLNTTGINGGNWFFTYAIDDKVDTTYEGEKIYQVCLIAKNYNDCADTLCKDVIVHAFPELIVPNVFTPGSSPNSHFYFPAKGIQDFECTIFNRYGVLVYQFTNISDQWDGNHFKTGKACSDGVYSYVYKAMSTNSTPFRGEGQVTLIRSD